MLKRRLPLRLTPLADSLGLRPFYGDLHNHCGLSYGHGLLEDALQHARQQLDFVSVTGHAHWPDMPVEDERVAHIVDFHVKGFAKLERAWPGHFALLEAAHERGRFTVFPGYEIHSCADGDYTIVYRDLDQRMLVKADNPAQLRQRLERTYPGRSMAFPHHIGYRQGARGINWETFQEHLSPVLEIFSMHGCAEDSLTDRPFLHSMGPSDGGSSAVHGLVRGHIFGFLGNTDHHSAYPGSYGHGRSCLYAPQNTNKALWEALCRRRTTALTGDCAHLFAAIDGNPQGSIIAPGKGLVLNVEAVAGGHVDYIDIVHNGRLTHRISPELSRAPIGRLDDGLETILVLEMGWGSRGTWHDWTGTIGLSGGEILAVEPRLRGPEIVSPLEGKEEQARNNVVAYDGDTIHFDLRSHANPNNLTPATQAIAAHVCFGPAARIHASFNGQLIDIEVARLVDGALSGNLGPIDSPAFRFHQLPLPWQWQWHGRIPLPEPSKGDHIYVRMRQKNGQLSWASPFFFR